ncbi:MAG: endonuclease/exonuclease/phosphatase family protein [Bdellovibrio sp.]|nr:endonuclease/exonuclease/phosphatase family protein [Bdellovibrio sp.]
MTQQGQEMQMTKHTSLFIFFVLSSTLLFSGKSLADEFTFRLMNYNIKGLPLPWLKHKARYKRIGQALNTLRGQNLFPDVINLQEAIHRHTEEIRKAAALPFYAKGPLGKGLRTSAGLKTLSRFEIVRVKEFVFDRCGSFDCLARKGVLMTTVKIPDLPFLIDIYATHTQAGPTGDPFISRETCDAIRDGQVSQMTNFILETHNSEHLLFVVGDFNFRQSDAMYWSFVDHLSLKHSAQECALVYKCAGADNPEEHWESMIDHQFYISSSNHGVTVTPMYFDRHFYDFTGGKRLSDHRATLVQYKIEWKK